MISQGNDLPEQIPPPDPGEVVDWRGHIVRIVNDYAEIQLFMLTDPDLQIFCTQLLSLYNSHKVSF